MADMELLQSTACWVNMTFQDGTVQSIHTTLNPQILSEYGAKLKNDHFFDLDRGVFLKFREDATSVSVSEEKPVYQEEVLRFASRFI